MRLMVERVVGIALVLGALFGLTLNAMAFYYLPRVETAALQRVEETLLILNGTLSTTAEALIVVDTSLVEAVVTMDTAESTTRGVSAALSDTLPLLDTMAEIAGQELPASLVATQLSLEAAQQGAVAVEGVLFALNSIPFLNAPVYNPEVPLATTLTAVSTSLASLPESLGQIEESINVAGGNLNSVGEDVTLLADGLGAIALTLDDAQDVTLQYQDVVAQQQTVVSDLQANAGTWIVWGGRALALLLTWLAIAQIGLLSQGIEMVSRTLHRHPATVER